MSIITYDSAQFHGLTAASQDAEPAEAVKKSVIGGNQKDLGIQKTGVESRASIANRGEANLACFFKRLFNKLVVRAKIDDGLSEFVEERLTNQEPDKRLPSSRVQLDDEIVFLASFIPCGEGFALAVPQ